MNAIILAAGLGSRFNEITQHTHKALLPVNGVPNIERTIEYLHEADIVDIHIVTGYKHHLFDYLSIKYQCNLIYNPFFDKYNSIYSFYCAKDHFHETFVIDADVVLFKNIFQAFDDSTYYTIQRVNKDEIEWIPELARDGYIDHIAIDKNVYPSLLGISFWRQNESDLIKQALPKYLSEEQLNNKKLYWDNIPMNLLPMLNIKTHQVSFRDAFEMDNIDNYNFIQKIANKDE